MFCCFNKPITRETLVQERHFTSDKMSFDIDSLSSEETTLADADLLKTSFDIDSLLSEETTLADADLLNKTIKD
ncbi:hypothetical protein L195_g059654, partial [Trifolium pratense]